MNMINRTYSIIQIMKKHPDAFERCFLQSNISEKTVFIPYFIIEDYCFGLERWKGANNKIIKEFCNNI